MCLDSSPYPENFSFSPHFWNSFPHIFPQLPHHPVHCKMAPQRFLKNTTCVCKLLFRNYLENKTKTHSKVKACSLPTPPRTHTHTHSDTHQLQLTAPSGHSASKQTQWSTKTWSLSSWGLLGKQTSENCYKHNENFKESTGCIRQL